MLIADMAAKNGWKAVRINGGADGDRTHDLQIANLALSQLSYCPTTLKNDTSDYENMAERVGFEPTVAL